jgi:hypothetical protein
MTTTRQSILVPSMYLIFKIIANKKHYSSQWEGEQFSLDGIWEGGKLLVLYGRGNSSRTVMKRRTILVVMKRRTIILAVLERRTT